MALLPWGKMDNFFLANPNCTTLHPHDHKTEHYNIFLVSTIGIRVRIRRGVPRSLHPIIKKESLVEVDHYNLCNKITLYDNICAYSLFTLYKTLQVIKNDIRDQMISNSYKIVIWIPLLDVFCSIGFLFVTDD